jgi:hypothetical protein
MKPDPLLAALFIVVAFVLAGLAHSAWLRSAASRRMMMPVDGGLRFRERRLFGENKTVRGFIVMVPAASASFVVLAWLGRTLAPSLAAELWPLSPAGYAAFGAWAGLGFMLGELPNSFIKRQLDIAPGAAPRSSGAAALSFVADRIDSIVGMLAAISLAVDTPPAVWAYVLVIGPAIHWSFSYLLYRLGVKARAA